MGRARHRGAPGGLVDRLARAAQRHPDGKPADGRRNYKCEQESSTAQLSPAPCIFSSLMEASVWVNGLEYHADGTLSDPLVTASLDRTEKAAVCKEKQLMTGGVPATIRSPGIRFARDPERALDRVGLYCREQRRRGDSRHRGQRFHRAPPRQRPSLARPADSLPRPLGGTRPQARGARLHACARGYGRPGQLASGLRGRRYVDSPGQRLVRGAVFHDHVPGGAQVGAGAALRSSRDRRRE